ncbi:hypothetical protein H0H87_003664 [Tephrocybe sp. NHM501043]|nr:hypothetical protein H0H87_003664 [Tephrocybe sp. NHM501043]
MMIASISNVVQFHENRYGDNLNSMESLDIFSVTREYVLAFTLTLTGLMHDGQRSSIEYSDWSSIFETCVLVIHLIFEHHRCQVDGTQELPTRNSSPTHHTRSAPAKSLFLAIRNVLEITPKFGELPFEAERFIVSDETKRLLLEIKTGTTFTSNEKYDLLHVFRRIDPSVPSWTRG